MFGSFLAIVIKGNYDVGGAGIVFDRNYQSGRIGELGLTQEARREEEGSCLTLLLSEKWVRSGLSQEGVRKVAVSRSCWLRSG
jgi:hypothetical protein